MKTLYAIKDDSANQVVSLYFVAQSEIEAIRQFKGFLNSGKYPAFRKELGLYEISQVKEDGSLFQLKEYVCESIDSDNDVYIFLKPILLCSGEDVESAYIEFSKLTKEDFEKLDVQKNISEADFDESVKNADWKR